MHIFSILYEKVFSIYNPTIIISSISCYSHWGNLHFKKNSMHSMRVPLSLIRELKSQMFLLLFCLHQNWAREIETERDFVKSFVYLHGTSCIYKGNALYKACKNHAGMVNFPQRKSWKHALMFQCFNALCRSYISNNDFGGFIKKWIHEL
jgi:hypothetical protein